MTDITFYAPIEKTDEEQHMVYGYASTEAVDSQGEIVKKDALKAALDDYMRYANIREMHQPSAVGKTKKANIDNKGLYIAAKVIDPLAWQKVKEGVYTGFSIGGRVKQQIDNEITELGLSEISLVDRPANAEAMIDMYKVYSAPEEKKAEEEVEKRDFTSAQRKAAAKDGTALPDGSFPIQNEEDLHNAVKAYGRAGNKAEAKKHIISRAKAMGMTSALPDDWTAKKAEETKDIEKEAGDAARFAGAADSLNYDIAAEQAEGDDETVSNLKIAQQALKDAATQELKEDEPDATGDEASHEMHMAEETKDMEKGKTKPEKKEAETPKESGTVEQTVKESEPQAQVTEQVVVAKSIETEVEELMQQGKMPSDEQISELLKAMEIEVSEKTIKITKFELAGKIIRIVEKSITDQTNKDAVISDMKKEVEKIESVIASDKKEGNEFEKAIALIDRLTEELKKEDAVYTPQDAPKVPEAQESPKSPATQGSSDLNHFIQVVQDLLTQTGRGALSDEEQQKLRDGVSAGSERFGEGHFDDDAQTNLRGDGDNDADDGIVEPVVQQAEQAKDLVKIEAQIAKIEQLEKRVKELEAQPMPVKAMASYATIEKFETTQNDEQTLLKKIDEVAARLKTNPSDATIQKEANALASEWMKQRRGAYGSSNQ